MFSVLVGSSVLHHNRLPVTVQVAVFRIIKVRIVTAVKLTTEAIISASWRPNQILLLRCSNTLDYPGKVYLRARSHVGRVAKLKREGIFHPPWVKQWCTVTVGEIVTFVTVTSGRRYHAGNFHTLWAWLNFSLKSICPNPSDGGQVKCESIAVMSGCHKSVTVSCKTLCLAVELNEEASLHGQLRPGLSPDALAQIAVGTQTVLP